MNIQIPYGDGHYTLDLPDATVQLSIKEPERSLTPERFVQAVQRGLEQRQADLTDTIVILADKTRLCGYDTYLPVLIEALAHAGLPEGGLRFLIAYGTHPRQSEPECLACYGETYRHYPFVHHDCTDTKAFSELGRTSRGVPVRLRRDILEASCVITMGPICHHYFAGYGGGRKLIFPGCGEREAIYANHGLYLDRENGRLASTCQPGVLENNPLAQDLFEIAAYKEADLAIHGIMDSHGSLCDILVGSGRGCYLEACDRHGDLCETAAESYPLVIASCGGFPKDINFIQSHKAVHNAAMFVEDGGTLIIYSECRDGIGSQTFLPWFDKGGFRKAFDHLCSAYQGNGGTALAMMTKTKRIRVAMVTGLKEDICRKMQIASWDHQKVQTLVNRHKSTTAYIANASLLVRKS